MTTATWDFELFDPSSLGGLRADVALVNRAQSLLEKARACRKVHTELQQFRANLRIKLNAAKEQISSDRLLDPDGVYLDSGYELVGILQDLQSSLSAIPLYGPFGSKILEEGITIPFWNFLTEVVRHEARIKATKKEYAEIEPYLPTPLQGSSGVLAGIAELLSAPFSRAGRASV